MATPYSVSCTEQDKSKLCSPPSVFRDPKSCEQGSPAPGGTHLITFRKPNMHFRVASEAEISQPKVSLAGGLLEDGYKTASFPLFRIPMRRQQRGGLLSP